MFFGSIPADVQAMMNKVVKSWDCSDVYIGGSGNFTMERFIYPLNKFKLHSNDITLYSECVGRYFMRQEVPLRLSEEGRDKMSFLEEYMQTDIDKVATMLLSTHFVGNIEKADHPYFSMLLNENKRQFPDLHKKTVEKIRATTVRIEDYTSEDPVEFARKAPNDAGFITYLPQKGVNRTFGKSYDKLEVYFEYTPVEIQKITPERMTEYFKEIMKKRCWCFATDLEIEDPEFAPFLTGVSKTTNRGAAVYVYSNSSNRQIVTPNQNTMAVKIPKLAEGMEIGNDIKLNIIPMNVFLALRSQYLNVHIAPGTPTVAIGVTVDGLLIGVYAFSSSPSLVSWDNYIETPSIYLMTDFPVEPVDYLHLSKLVCYSILSTESRKIAERVTKYRVRSVVTTAFSNRPQSMKYRGLFRVLNRRDLYEEIEATTEEEIALAKSQIAHRYSVNYGAEIGAWSLQEGLEMWKKKYSQKR